MLEVLQWYSLLSWIKYPLALRARHRVSVSSSGIVPSWRYSTISFYQSTSGLSGPTTAITSPVGPGFGAIGPAEAFGLASGIGNVPLSPGEAPGTGAKLHSSRGPPGEHAGVSSSSHIEGLNRSCTNTPDGGDSLLDPSRARESAASLSRQRIWWSSKSSNFSSSLLTSYR
jgi:hypothetical protein